MTHPQDNFDAMAVLNGACTGLPADRWRAPDRAGLNGLSRLATFQAYFAAGSVETEIDRIGWSGRLILGTVSDYMMEVESNYYGTKSNYFLSRHYSVVLTRSGTTLHHTVTIDLTNNEPFGAEARSTYKADVRLYIGDAATAASTNLRPVKYPNPASPAHTELVMAGWMSHSAVVRAMAFFSTTRSGLRTTKAGTTSTGRNNRGL